MSLPVPQPNGNHHTQETDTQAAILASKANVKVRLGDSYLNRQPTWDYTDSEFLSFFLFLFFYGSKVLLKTLEEKQALQSESGPSKRRKRGTTSA